jgi:hypothetical protein
MFDVPSMMAHKEIYLNHIEAKKKLIENRSKEEWIKDFLSVEGIQRLKESTYYELLEDAKLFSFLEKNAYWFEYDEEEALSDREDTYSDICARHSNDEDQAYYNQQFPQYG